jgi:hypothetical protein
MGEREHDGNRAVPQVFHDSLLHNGNEGNYCTRHTEEAMTREWRNEEREAFEKRGLTASMWTSEARDGH